VGSKGVGVSHEKLDRNCETVSTVSDCLVDEEDICVGCCEAVWLDLVLVVGEKGDGLLQDSRASNITAAERYGLRRYRTLEELQVRLNHADGCLGCLRSK
jgi:hypothetical protein